MEGTREAKRRVQRTAYSPEYYRRRNARKRLTERWLETEHGGPPGRPVAGLPADQVRVTPEGQVWARAWHQFVWIRKKLYCRGSCLKVSLSVRANGITQHGAKTVASLVCRAFHGPRPLGCVPWHYPDPSPTNCRADNLRWAPRGTRKLGVPSPNSSRFGYDRPSPTLKLTPASVRQIRHLYRSGSTYKALADQFGVSRSYIGKIVRRWTWKHVT